MQRRKSSPLKAQMSQIIDVAYGNPLSSGTRGMLNHIDAPPQMLFYPGFSTSRVALINPDMFETRIVRLYALQESNCRSILHICRMDLEVQDQSQGINKNLTFSPVYFLAAIIATGPPF